MKQLRYFKKIPSLQFTIKCIALVTFFVNTNLVFAQVSAEFSYAKSCDGVVTFTPKNTGYDSYEWDFGNSTSSTLISPTINYAAKAIKKYSVSLIVKHKGISFKQTRDIQINPKATARVNYKKSICEEETVTYKVTDPESHFRYAWDSENAHLSGDKNSSQIFVVWNTPGNYLITLKVSDNNGCDTLLKLDVAVHGMPQPNLSFPGSDSSQNKNSADIICQDNSKEFTIFPSTGIPLNPKSTYSWTSSCANAKSDPTKDNIVFQFPNIGKCIIKLTETNEFGCIGSAEKEVNVLEKPIIKLSLADGCLGGINSFYASAPPRSLVHYEWDFGDGISSTLKNPDHKYNIAGKYQVYFVGTDDLGCVDTVKNEISIDDYPGPPITCVGTLCAGDEVVYTTPLIAGASYYWKVTGGAITANGTLTDNSIKIKWGKTTYGEIELRISGTGQHCKNPTKERINLLGENYPISGSTNPCRGEAQVYSTDLVNGATYRWTVTPPAYIYQGQGTNQVSVAWNGVAMAKINVVIEHAILDCVSVDELDVRVKDKFSVYGQPTPCIKESYIYSAYPQTSAYQWELGSDGIIESGQNSSSAKIKWLTPGTHQIIIKNAIDFCNSEFILNVDVKEVPKTNITGAKTACKLVEESYSLGGDAKIVKWIILSGGTAQNGMVNNSLQVKWNTIGNHKILAIYNSSGIYCQDTALLTVTVIDNSMPEILGDTVVCINELEKYTLKGNYNNAMNWEISGADYEIASDKKSVDIKWTDERTGIIRLINTVCYSEIEKLVIIKPVLNPTFVLEKLNCDGTIADIKVVEEFKKYTWNTSETTQAITVTSAGTFSVAVETVWGCSGYGEITLTKLPSNKFESASLKLTAGVSNSPYPYIIGEIVSVPDAEKYLWKTGETTREIYINASGDYTCKITNEYGCSEEFTFKVVVDLTTGTCTSGSCTGKCNKKKLSSNCNYPVFSVKNPLCNPIEFTALVNATYYHWDFGDKIYSTDKNPKHRFTTAGYHTVDIYYSNDGIDWEKCSQTIEVKSLINAMFDSKILCNGSVDFTDKTTSALGITSKLWEFGDSKSSTASNASYTYTPPTQNFKVKLSINDGVCTDFIEKDIKVNWLKADFKNTGSCINMPVFFNSTPLHTSALSAYRWDFGNNSKEFYANPSTMFNKAQNYQVKLWVKDAKNCKDSITKTIGITSPNFPKLTASGALKFCEGKSINLTAAKNLLYRWNNMDTTQSITVKKAGQFYVRLTDKTTGCKGNSDTVKTQIIPKPKAVILVPYYSSNCENNYLYLNADYNNNYTFDWFKNSVSLNNKTYYFQLGPTTPNDGGLYKLIVTEKLTGCSDTASKSINIYPSPKIPFITVLPSGTLCSNQIVTLTANNIDPFNKLHWNTKSINRKITIHNSDYYTVNVINNFGCASKAYKSVTIYNSPDINIFPTGCYSICESKKIEIKLVEDGITTYTWNDGFKGATRKLTVAGVYNITADNSNCISKSKNLSLDILKFNSNLLEKDTCLPFGKYKNLNIISGNFTDIKWNTGSIGSGIQITKPGKYWVSVKTKEGCQITDTITIDSCNGFTPIDTTTSKENIECDKSKYFIPNAFSVNNDGLNEYYVIPKNSKDLRLARLTIYNRWGEKVFTTTDPEVSWDGSVNGQAAQLEAYVYICQYMCGYNFYQQTGTVTLIK